MLKATSRRRLPIAIYQFFFERTSNSCASHIFQFYPTSTSFRFGSESPPRPQSSPCEHAAYQYLWLSFCIVTVVFGAPCNITLHYIKRTLQCVPAEILRGRLYGQNIRRLDVYERADTNRPAKNDVLLFYTFTIWTSMPAALHDKFIEPKLSFPEKQ